jgi:hypothetical protein
MLTRRLALLVLFAVARAALGRDELAEVARFSELVEQAQRQHIDYPAVAARAERGDTQALHILFGFTRQMDGAAADSHCAALHLLLKQLGDKGFSDALRKEPGDLRNRVMQAIDYDIGRPWGKSFPLTYSLGSHDTKLLRGK